MQKPVNLSQLDSPERNISRIVSEDHSEQVQKSTQHDNTQKEKAQERTVSSSFRLSIKPRRKRNSGKLVSPSCVVVSPEVVESLRELALPDAARSIGISVTAFKAACRRLGIRRWNHTRGRSRKQNNDVGIGEERVSSPIDYSHPPAPRPALNVTGEAGRLAAWHDSELSSTESWLYSSDSDEENLTLVAHQISGSTDTGQSRYVNGGCRIFDPNPMPRLSSCFCKMRRRRPTREQTIGWCTGCWLSRGRGRVDLAVTVMPEAFKGSFRVNWARPF